ncbi:hypothetical protein AMJ49_03345 [Parcubacteria bacterium DG_74_2]|nr:MAG: hypothetical protein AMJ49_03345 [Parcubacteria bacterium DG_74_2]
MKLSKFTFLIFFFLIAFFLVLNLTPLSGKFKNFFYLISSPVQRFFWRSGDKISDFFSGIFRAESLKKENENLRLENKKLLQEIAFLNEIKNENERLREALKISLEEDFELIFANVIGKETSKDVLIIDKGLEDGVKEGFPAITEGKILCGNTSKALDDFSKIQLLTSKETSFDVKILNSENEIFKAKGEGGSEILLEFIPKEIEIGEGNLVISSAQGGIFPKGLLVGKITKIEKSDLEPFQKAQILPACQIEEIENLFLIKKW